MPKSLTLIKMLPPPFPTLWSSDRDKAPNISEFNAEMKSEWFEFFQEWMAVYIPSLRMFWTQTPWGSPCTRIMSEQRWCFWDSPGWHAWWRWEMKLYHQPQCRAQCRSCHGGFPTLLSQCCSQWVPVSLWYVLTHHLFLFGSSELCGCHGRSQSIDSLCPPRRCSVTPFPLDAPDSLRSSRKVVSKQLFRVCSATDTGCQPGSTDRLSTHQKATLNWACKQWWHSAPQCLSFCWPTMLTQGKYLEASCQLLIQSPDFFCQMTLLGAASKSTEEGWNSPTLRWHERRESTSQLLSACLLDSSNPRKEYLKPGPRTLFFYSFLISIPPRAENGISFCTHYPHWFRSCPCGAALLGWFLQKLSKYCKFNYSLQKWCVLYSHS